VTADELMRLVSRYVEACDDLGEGLFEKPLSTTDALHATATELHGQILAEVYRLHAKAAPLTSQHVDAVVRSVQPNLDAGCKAWRELSEQCRYWLEAARALGPNVGGNRLAPTQEQR